MTLRGGVPMFVEERRRIGELVRIEREAQGLTQAELGDGALTKAAISAIERGRAWPSVPALLHLARRLGVPVRELLP